MQLIVTWVTDLLGGADHPARVLSARRCRRSIFALPFAAMFSTPLLIYVGEIPPERYAEAMGLQAAAGWWCSAALATVMWRAGARRVVVQGG